MLKFLHKSNSMLYILLQKNKRHLSSQNSLVHGKVIGPQQRDKWLQKDTTSNSNTVTTLLIIIIL